jgi:hypothetical protein
MMAEAGPTSAMSPVSLVQHFLFSSRWNNDSDYLFPSLQNKSSPTGAGEFLKQSILSPAAAGRDVLRLFYLRRR